MLENGTGRAPQVVPLSAIIVVPFSLDIRNSFILYRKAGQTTVGSLHAKVARGDVLPQQAAARALMQKIREGVYLSEYAAGWLRDAVRDCPWG